MILRSVIAVASGLAIVVGAVAMAEQKSLRQQLLEMPVTAQLGGDGSRPLASDNAFSFQTPNSPARHQRPFSFGNRLFNTNWVESPSSVKTFDGLGPLFNRVSCSGCHTKDGRGQPPANGEGPMESMLVRLSLPGQGPHGGVNPVPGYGDQLNERGTTGVTPEGRVQIRYTELPGHYGDGTSYSLRQPSLSIVDLGYGPLPKEMLMSPRVAPQMIGLGLLESVPAATLQALADPDDADGDGISGRLNHVWDAASGAARIGRFGWKANQPSLLQQNTGAAAGDIGITADGPDPEINAEFLHKLTLYTATLAVPEQRNAERVGEGEKQFRAMGCAACHMPTLQTGANEALPELANQTFHPFTDVLLHDMGDGLADNRPDFEATGREWRTPPLWGLGLVPLVNGHHTLLHDGRARSFEEAILWHGGEAEAAREAFRMAPQDAREAVVQFLRSL